MPGNVQGLGSAEPSAGQRAARFKRAQRTQGAEPEGSCQGPGDDQRRRMRVASARAR